MATSVSKSNKQHSGYSHYSPISTLERQYTTPGQRILLLVKTNGNCCIAGGVETILKTGSSKNSNQVLAHEQANGTDPTTLDGNEGVVVSDNPFSFLEEDQPEAEPPVGNAADGTKKKGPNIGRFLKKVAKTTTQQLERGVTNLAILANDPGRNPDRLWVGLYDGNEETLLFRTEEVALPENEAERLQGVRFGIPLVLPATVTDGQKVAVKLWIRSGSTWLSQANAAKNYWLGTVHLPVAHVRQRLATATDPKQPAVCIHSTLQSTLVVDGHLSLTVVPDSKFPRLCGPASSLTDPDVQSYWKPDCLFNLPLDQAYGMPLPSSATLLMTERTTESVVILPVAAAVCRLTAAAAQVSLRRAQTVTSQVLAARHDSAVGLYYDVQVNIGSIKTQHVRTSPLVSAVFQRADSIFEVELLQPTSVPVQAAGAPQGFASSSSFRFFPKPCHVDILPSILQSLPGAQVPQQGLVGNVRLQVVIPKQQTADGKNSDNPFGPVGTGMQAIFADAETWDCIVSLDALLAQPAPPVREFPVVSTATGQTMGSLVVSVAIQQQQGPPVATDMPPAQQGLVSLMGLASLTEAGIRPEIDFETTTAPLPDPQQERRRQQLATMGQFVAHAYMEQHVNQIRTPDTQALEVKSTRYRQALESSLSTENGAAAKVPPDKDRSPRPFRPSSSRSEPLLAGIGFNIHYASLTLQVLDPEIATGQQPPAPELFNNITCGAPADHGRGFSDVFAKKKDAPDVGLRSPVGSVSGGLRRLETRRRDLAKVLTDLQTELTMSVGNFFVEARQQGKQAVNHVPARHTVLQGLRWKVFEAAQSLHHLTWICAVRRANVFSQALGIALSSYLAAISDVAMLQSKWPSLWARHGYLVSFEGMLSAAGKELGMIEDAHCAVAMLGMVRVVLVPDDGVVNKARVPVVSSPYLKWVDLAAAQTPSETVYTLTIGVVPSYYEQRIPAPLKNGTPIRFYSLLFEVGVDIRQWASYSGSNVKNQISPGDPNSSPTKEKAPVGGLIDDEDDDVGASDEDVLVQLNFEAFQKLNVYAYAVVPAASAASQSVQQTHPLLETLYQHIASSGGKINHDILDEAAGLAQQLGGGAVVFCKSGKDRTAMHVTFKQAQFANRSRQQKAADPSRVVADSTLSDAMLMRLYGTRLPICEKNVGVAKYAFNSLQVKFMPDALRPPPSALAGFAGAEIFKGGDRIQS